MARAKQAPLSSNLWLQMQLNPQQPDPMQQAIFNWMPLLFTFMLAGFASGLVIYWAWNNTLSVIQQYIIMRANGAETEVGKFVAKYLGGRKAPAE
jgi:YidC/Oxa1 family membrane protein insertase